MQEEGNVAGQDLKENLLAEFNREITPIVEGINADLEQSQLEKIEKMEQKEQMDRYMDILNVHSAAVNMS